MPEITERDSGAIFELPTRRPEQTGERRWVPEKREDLAARLLIDRSGSFGFWEGARDTDALLYTTISQLTEGATFVMVPSLIGLSHVQVDVAPVRDADFQAALRELLDEAPVEPGFEHAAVGYLRETLERGAARSLLRQAWEQLNELRPELLECMSRIPALADVGSAFAEALLRSGDVIHRDAAVHALERWGGGEAIEILKGHHEADPMLADYVERVIRDLTT